MNIRHHDLKTAMWLLALLLAPLIIVSLVPQMHAMDIATFNSWLDAFQNTEKHSLVDFYKLTTSNYPVIASAISVGLLGLVKSLTAQQQDFWAYAKNFRYALSLFEFFNGAMIFWYLSRKQIKYAGAIALFFICTPSAWAPASIWGQIDGFNQSLLLITLISCLMWYESLNTKGQSKSYMLYAFLSLFGFTAMLFAKQTLVFALPYLFCIIAYNVYNQWRAGNDHHKSALTVLISFAWCSYWVLDYSFNLPEHFKSQLAYIWTSGINPHADAISFNGFNIWAQVSNSTSALEPLFLSFTPKYLGLVFFAFFSIYLVRRLTLLLKRTHNSSFIPDKIKSAHLLLIFSLSQLSFNLFLTGTHERYLYHFYPTFLLSLVLLHSLKQIKFRELVVASMGSVAYGVFVWSVLFHPDDLSYRWEHLGMFALHSYFFGFAIYLEHRLSKKENELNQETSLQRIIESAKRIAS